MFFFLSNETHITTLTLPQTTTTKTRNKILLQSLSPFVKGLTIYQSHPKQQQEQEQYTKAKFHATSVMRFTEFKQENPITMSTIERLIENLTNQIDYLSKEYNHTFYRINPNDILVIDFSQFLYISSDDLMPLTKSESTTNPESPTIIFTMPFCKDYYISPEIKEITSLPSRINAKTIYYSLGSFIIDLLYTFFSIKERKTTTTTTTTTIKIIPTQIKYTKLYWFLHKATLPNPKDRQLLFI
jgi:hypothetical protein